MFSQMFTLFFSIQKHQLYHVLFLKSYEIIFILFLSGGKLSDYKKKYLTMNNKYRNI